MAQAKLKLDKKDSLTRVGYKPPLLVLLGKLAPGAEELTFKMFKGSKLPAQIMQWALGLNPVYKKLGAPRPQFEDGFEPYSGRLDQLADPTNRRGLAAKTLQQVEKLDTPDRKTFIELLNEAPSPTGDKSGNGTSKSCHEFQGKLRNALDGNLKPVARLFPSAAGSPTKLMEEVEVLKTFVLPKTPVGELIPVITKQIAKVEEEIESSTSQIRESLVGSIVPWTMLSAYWYESKGAIDEVLVIHTDNPEAALATRASKIRDILKKTKAAGFDILPLSSIGSLQNLTEFLSFFDKKTELSGGLWVGMEVADEDDARKLAAENQRKSTFADGHCWTWVGVGKRYGIWVPTIAAIAGVRRRLDFMDDGLVSGLYGPLTSLFDSPVDAKRIDSLTEISTLHWDEADLFALADSGFNAVYECEDETGGTHAVSFLSRTRSSKSAYLSVDLTRFNDNLVAQIGKYLRAKVPGNVLEKAVKHHWCEVATEMFLAQFEGKGGFHAEIEPTAAKLSKEFAFRCQMDLPEYGETVLLEDDRRVKVPE